MDKKGLLDYICEALEKREAKAGFIILEVETGKEKTFGGIDLIAVDLKGDNAGLAKRFFEENGNDSENIESEFLSSLFDEYDKSKACSILKCDAYLD
jgi:hypothetical protein